MKIEQTVNGVTIAASGVTLTLNHEEAWKILEYLYSRRDSLYASQKEWDDATWHKALRETRLQGDGHEQQ